MAPGQDQQHTEELAHSRWEQMWSAGLNKGDFFDTGVVSPALQQLLDAGALPKGRALVPGCGRGYDVLAFAAAGYEALGLDLSTTGIAAARALLAETGAPAGGGAARFEEGNFFEFEPERKFNVVLDYTFLCALDPSIRQQWAKHMASCLDPAGELLTLIFPIGKPASAGGPPFGVSLDLLKELLEPVGLEATELRMLPDELCHKSREGMTGIGRWRFKAG